MVKTAFPKKRWIKYRYRQMDGQKFRWAGQYGSKTRAQQMAGVARGEGKLARVVPSRMGTWTLYIR